MLIFSTDDTGHWEKSEQWKAPPHLTFLSLNDWRIFFKLLIRIQNKLYWFYLLLLLFVILRLKVLFNNKQLNNLINLRQLHIFNNDGHNFLVTDLFEIAGFDYISSIPLCGSPFSYWCPTLLNPLVLCMVFHTWCGRTYWTLNCLGAELTPKMRSSYGTVESNTLKFQFQSSFFGENLFYIVVSNIIPFFLQSSIRFEIYGQVFICFLIKKSKKVPHTYCLMPIHTKINRTNCESKLPMYRTKGRPDRHKVVETGDFFVWWSIV